LRTLIIDFVVWKYAYKQESKLFLYWHFGAILQKTSFYDKDFEPHADDVIQLTARFYLLSNLINQLRKNDPSIAKFDDAYLEKSLLSIFEHNNISDVLNDLKTISSTFINTIFDMDERYDFHINEMLGRSKELKEKVELYFGTDTSSYTFKQLDIISEEMPSMDKCLREDIRTHRVIDSLKNLKPFIEKLSNCEDCIEANEFAKPIIDVLHNHLSKVKDLTTKGKDQDKFRFDQFVLNKDNIEQGAGIMFNPQGGAFSTEAQVREQLLRLNSSFYYELWDLAQVQKKAVLERLCNNEEV